MSDAKELSTELNEQQLTGNEVAVGTARDTGVVTLAVGDIDATLEPDEARQFAENLRERAEENGWYHSGQTQQLIEDIETAADTVA